MTGTEVRHIIKGKKLMAALLFGMISVMSGCAFNNYIFQTQEVELPVENAERRISLEEMERKAQEMDESDEDNAVPDTEEWELPENGSLLYDEGFKYAYATLDENERIWYQDMAKALGVMASKVKLSEAGIKGGLNEDVVDKIFQCVLSDHPELFYVEGYSYTKYTRGDKTVAIEFTGTYSIDWDTAVERRRMIEDNVNILIKGAPDSDDDYGKIKYAYETLINNTDYDVNAADNQNIYSVFVGHASVCQGYAKAFQYLTNRMGIDCTLVQGEVLETGEGHAWNLVKSNGKYYYTDATWGDISYQSDGKQTQDAQENLPSISYDYLCITSELLERTHVISGSEPMPECVAEDDNYFVREGALFKDYDSQQLENLVERMLDEGNSYITLRCADGKCYKEMYESLVERQEIFEYLAGTGINSFVYTNSDKQYTITFFMVTNSR